MKETLDDDTAEEFVWIDKNIDWYPREISQNRRI